MLNSLGFNLTVPTPNTFLPRYIKAGGSKDKPKADAFHTVDWKRQYCIWLTPLQQHVQVITYASYLVELAMQESSMLRYPYSMVATAAVYLANMVRPMQKCNCEGQTVSMF